MTLPQNGSFSEQIVRQYAPPFIAVPYRLAESTLFDERYQYERARELCAGILHYVAGILIAEYIGLGLGSDTAPASVKVLLGKLDHASWGDQSQAAHALARVLLERAESSLIAPEVARLYFARDGRNNLVETPFATAMRALVEQRNKEAHQSRSPRDLLHEFRSHLRIVIIALEVLRHVPLLYLDTLVEDAADGSRRAKLLRLCGPEFDVETIDIRDCTVPTGTPFLASAAGSILRLSPFVELQLFDDTFVYAARLMRSCNGSKGIATYADPHGGRPATHKLAAEWACDPVEWLGKPAHFFRRDGAIRQDQRAAFRVPRSDGAIPHVDGYLIESLLGRGAGGRVYLARSVGAHGPGQQVALKFLNPQAGQVQAERLKREAQAIQRIAHPGIVRVHEFVSDSRHGPYLVMDYIQGSNLEAAVASGPLDVDRAITICEQVLHALKAAHECRIFHRDIKPSNILIEAGTGLVRVIDFGIAHDPQATRHTHTLQPVGTPGFAAPEQLELLDVVQTADIYGVGRLLEYLLKGASAFQATDGAGAPRSSDDPSEATRALPPPGIAAIIRKATQRDCAHRYQTVDDMLRAIDERRDASWQGSPVASGDMLNDSYELHRQVGRLADGLHLFRAAEIETDDNVGIIVEDRTAGRTAQLRRAITAAVDEVRETAAYRGLHQTRDGLRFAVLRGGDALYERALSLLAGTPYRPSRTAVPRALQDSPWVDALALEMAAHKYELDVRPAENLPTTFPPYLRGFLLPTRLGLHDLLTITDLLAGVIAAQMMARGAMSADREGPSVSQLIVLPGTQREAWRNFTLDRLADAAFRDRHFATLMPVAEQAEEVGVEYQQIKVQRNRVHHGAAAGMPLADYARSICKLTQSLLQLAADLGAHVEADHAWPVLARMEDDQWAVLVPAATKLVYRALCMDEPGREYPLPDEVAQWAAQSANAKNLTNAEIQRSRAQLQRERRATTIETLRQWDQVVTVEEAVRTSARSVVADVLARDARGRVLLAVDTDLAVLESAFRSFDGDIREPLQRLAESFGAPFVAATDGVRWRWFHRSREVFEELVDFARVQAEHRASSERA